MSSKKIINNKYGLLCKELGHLINNKDKLETRISQIKNEINALDSLVPEFEVFEKQEEIFKNKPTGVKDEAGN